MSKKNAGPVDFGGQQGRDEADGQSPAGETSDREMTVNYKKVPTIDDPSKDASSVVYPSDDVRLHAARSEVGGDYSGVKVP